MLKTVKLRLKLDYLQKLKLETLANEHRLLYNHLLDYSRSTYKETAKLDFNELFNEAKKFNKEYNLTASAKSVQLTVFNLIQNYKSFFTLNKKFENDRAIDQPRAPFRFKGWKYFCSFSYDYAEGKRYKIIDNKLYIQTSPVQNRKKTLDLIIDLPKYFTSKKIDFKDTKLVTFSRIKDKYYVSIVYDDPGTGQILDKNKFMSVDLGVTNLVTGYSNTFVNASGIQIINNNFSKEERRINELKSKRDKGYTKYSRRYNKINETLTRVTKKRTNSRKTFQHQVSSKLVDLCADRDIGTLIIGDLEVKKLKDSKVSSKGLNRSTQNSGLSRFKSMLNYKAPLAGIDIYWVNESHTSKTNCLTGERNLDNSLDVRQVDLGKGIIIDRDLNSAINIAKRHLSNIRKEVEDFRYPHFNLKEVERRLLDVPLKRVIISPSGGVNKLYKVYT